MFLIIAVSFGAFRAQLCIINLLKAKRNLLYIRNRPYRAVNTLHHGYEKPIS